MKKRIRQIQRLRRSREMARDGAAAGVARRELEQRSAEDVRISALERLDQLRLDAGKELEAVEGISEIEHIAAMLVAAQAAVRDAEVAVAVADNDTAAALSCLNVVERELRVSDELLDRARSRNRSHQEQQEQRHSDDMVGARWRAS